MKTTMTLIFLVLVQYGIAQSNDPLFPNVRKFNLGLISTYTGNPPPVAIVDLTYGISKKTSLGLVGGTTGTLALFGLRLNSVVFQNENFRTLFRMNAIYYPGRHGEFLFDKSFKKVMPWMFTMGVVDAEWKTAKGVRWTVGLGYLETHCIDGMMRFLHLSNHVDEDDLQPFHLYNVLHGGMSFPLSKKISLRPEIVVVMCGMEVIKKTNDSKISPFNPYLNLVYTF